MVLCIILINHLALNFLCYQKFYRMARESSLGARLVENFNLLLEYAPCEECAQCVDEHMFLRADKRSFFVVMSYFLDLIDPDWKLKMPKIIITKQDERSYFTGLCQYLKVLKKDYPEVDLPSLTPSSMICFSGDKSREVLLKISNALMLRAMKKENFDMDGVDAEEHNLNEYESICQDNCKLRTAIENILQQNAQGISLYINIISMIISAGPWDDIFKTRLIDLTDTTIITDIQNENTKLFNEFKVLTEKLQPYFDHFHHYKSGVTCSCPEMYHCSSDTFSKCCDVLCKFTKNVIETHLQNLKCCAGVKAYRIENKMDGFDKIKFDEKVYCELINKLESKICGFFKGDIGAGYSEIYLPLTFKSCSSPEISGFSPMIVCDAFKLRKQTQKLKVQSLSDNLAPVKIDVSPINHLNNILSHPATKHPVCNESVSTILQRLRSKATPLKFSKENSTSLINLRTPISTGCQSSRKLFGNTERFTPITMPLNPMISQSTNRRHSMGFVKPSDCFVRKRLLSSRISEKNKLNIPTTEAGKSKEPNIVCIERRSNVVDLKSEGQEDLLHHGLSTVKQSPSGQSPHVYLESPVLDERKCLSVVKCGKSYESREMKSDCSLDLIVQKMIEEESSLSSNMSGFLDSSLSGVEHLPTTSLNDIKSQNTDNEDANNPDRGPPETIPNMSSIVSDIISIDNELDCTINSIINEDSSVVKSISDSSSDESDDLADPSTVTGTPRKSHVEQLTELKEKTCRDSLGLLIERFKAIKKNCNV